jgi:hypothetical protein
MKRLILLSLSLGLCIYGWMQIRDEARIPAGRPRWNPFALKESGFGRTLARVFTEQANASYHHGLLERKPPLSTNPLSHWLDAGSVALGFQGRLKYRPVERYPLRPSEVRQALDQVEKSLRLAFELDPGNYTAYDVYFYFLTNEVTQTEFASLEGAQLKDEDDDEKPDQGGNSAEREDSGPTGAEKPQAGGNQKSAGPAQPNGALQLWAEQERQRRQTRAIEITDEAIRKFRPNTMDPERFLTAAVMWYNRFMVLAPDPEERQKSAEARSKFAEMGPLTLTKMRYYIDAARNCQHDLEAKGMWQAIPERRAEYLRVMQLIDKCAFTLSSALQRNRAQMTQDRPGGSVWAGPLGQN